MDLRKDARGVVDILIQDEVYGEFPLSPTCLIEYLTTEDLETPVGDDVDVVWRRLTYEELLALLLPIMTPTS